MVIMKNKNKIAKIILSTMLLMLSTACESILEIEPVSQIPGSAFWNNNDDANLGVVAIYDAKKIGFIGENLDPITM